MTMQIGVTLAGSKVFHTTEACPAFQRRAPYRRFGQIMHARVADLKAAKWYWGRRRRCALCGHRRSEFDA